VRFGRGLSLERDDFVQEVCCRALRYPPSGSFENDRALQEWLVQVTRTVRMHHVRSERTMMRRATRVSLDQLPADEVPPDAARQFYSVLLGELADRGREGLVTRSRLPVPQQRRWDLLWKVGGGHRPGRKNKPEQDDLYAARKLLREDFAP